MAEPFKLANPFSRIVDIRSKSLYHGLADPLVPNHAFPEIINGKSTTTLNRVWGRDIPENWWHKEEHFRANAYQFNDNTAGMFSGEMRKVVQDNRSRGIPLSYSPNFEATHGVFVASNGDRYIIEITSGGIYAWSLPKKTTTDPDNQLDSLDYVPGKADRPDTVISLSGTGLSGAGTPYSALVGPLFSECGWAFNSDGTKACAVTFEDRQDAPDNPGPLYPFSRLWEITITEESNKPKSYSVAEIDSGWLWGDRITIVKFPLYFEKTLDYFDWFRGNLTVTPDADGTEGPIHAWYNSSDQMEVCTFKNYVEETASVPAWTGIDFNYPIDGQPQNEGSWLGSYTKKRGITNGFSTPVQGYHVGFYDSGSYRKRYNLGGQLLGTDPDSDEGSCTTGVHTSYYKTVSNGVESSTAQDVLVIPFFERCGVFHIRSERYYEDSVGGTTWAWEAQWIEEGVGTTYFAADLYSGFPTLPDGSLGCSMAQLRSAYYLGYGGGEYYGGPNYLWPYTAPSAAIVDGVHYGYITAAACGGYPKWIGPACGFGVDGWGLAAQVFDACVLPSYPAGCVANNGNLFGGNCNIFFDIAPPPYSYGCHSYSISVIKLGPVGTFCGYYWNPGDTFSCCTASEAGAGTMPKPTAPISLPPNRSAGYENEVIVYSSALHVDETTYYLPANSDLDLVWHTRYWDGGSGGSVDWASVHIDASGNMQPIYTEVQYPNGAVYNSGEFWNWGVYAGYNTAVSELQKLYPQWLGNPI